MIDETRRDTPRPNRILKGAERQTAMRRAAALYNQGRSIREVGAELGLSYGGTRDLIRQSGTTLRPRGGSSFRGRRRG